MRPLTIVGIVLLVLGAFVLIRGVSFTRQHDVVRIGDVKVTAGERERIPGWAGGVAVVVGAAIVLAGARQRRSV